MTLGFKSGEADLAYARFSLTAITEELSGGQQRYSPDVIASVGNLIVRIDSAAALACLSSSFMNDASFRLAAAEAARTAEQMLTELVGLETCRPLRFAGEPTLTSIQTALGDYLLNEVDAIDLLKKAVC